MSTNPRRRPGCRLPAGFPNSTGPLPVSPPPHRTRSSLPVFLERRLSRETGAVIMTAGISVQFDFSERHHRAIVRRRTGFDRMDSNGDCRKAGRPRPVTGGQSSRMDALQNQVLFLEAERRRRLELQRIEASLKRIETGDYRSDEHTSELQSLMRI